MKIISVLEHRLGKKIEGTEAKGTKEQRKGIVQKYTTSVQQMHSFPIIQWFKTQYISETERKR